MRFKVAPGPVDPALLAAVQAAVPLVPGSVDDCCARIVDRTAVDAREDAEAWLTFLRALDLAAETDRGYERRRRDPTDEAVGEAFAERVFGAAELLTALADADGPLSAGDAFEDVRGIVPEWERNRHDDWEAVWRERVRRLLEWAVVFDLATRADGGYERA